MSKKYLFYSIKIQPKEFAQNETALRETAVAEGYLYPKNSAKIYYIVTFTFYTLKIPQKSTIWQLLLSIPKNFRKNQLYFKFFLQNSTIVLLLLSIPKIFRKNLLYCYFYFLYPKNSTKIYYIENLLKKYYMATFTFYTQKIPQKFTILLLLFSIPKKFR